MNISTKKSGCPRKLAAPSFRLPDGNVFSNYQKGVMLKNGIVLAAAADSSSVAAEAASVTNSTDCDSTMCADRGQEDVTCLRLASAFGTYQPFTHN